MTPELQKIKERGDLPSLPSAAVELIRLAQDPEVADTAILRAIACDPVLSGKILSTANSAWYGASRENTTLQQALRVLGLNSVLAIALSFSLMKTIKSQSAGLDPALVWKRSILCAMSAKTLSSLFCMSAHAEELFLAGLLQDIAVLLLYRLDPAVYIDGPSLQKDHGQMALKEAERFGHDHAQVGAWMLSGWGLPEKFVSAVSFSHRFIKALDEGRKFEAVVALSGELADLILWDGAHDRQQPLFEHAARAGYGPEQIGTMIETLFETLPEINKLFDTEVFTESTEALIAKARKLVAQRQTELLNKKKK